MLSRQDRAKSAFAQAVSCVRQVLQTGRSIQVSYFPELIDWAAPGGFRQVKVDLILGQQTRQPMTQIFHPLPPVERQTCVSIRRTKSLLDSTLDPPTQMPHNVNTQADAACSFPYPLPLLLLAQRFNWTFCAELQPVSIPTAPNGGHEGEAAQPVPVRHG
jgi:hypothetical protein